MKSFRIIRRVQYKLCGARSSDSKRAMSCELPEGHYSLGWEFHFGPDRLNRYRTWEIRTRFAVIEEFIR